MGGDNIRGTERKVDDCSRREGGEERCHYFRPLARSAILATGGAHSDSAYRQIESVVRVMQGSLEIRNKSAAQAPAVLVLICSPGRASVLQH